MSPTKKDRALKVITTIGVPMSGNNGSASMLFGLIDNLNKELKRINFNVFSYYPKKDRLLNRYKNVRIYSGNPMFLLSQIVPRALLIFVCRKLKRKIPDYLLTKEVRAFLDADLILDVGGTTFTDAKQYKAFFSVLCLLPGILLGKKQIKISQTMGPFNGVLNRFLASTFLPKLDLIIGRGKESEQCLKKLGLKKTAFRTDASFTMKVEKTIVLKMKKRYKAWLGKKKIVGIAPNSIVEGYCEKKGKDHAQILARFIDYLANKDYLVFLIPHSLRLGARSKHNNDLFTIREIYRQVKQKKNCLKIEDAYSPQELRALIGLTDFFIASRFHSMISALAMAVPLNVYGWGFHKYSEVMKEFHLEKNVFDYNELEIKKMVKRFEELVRNQKTITGKIKKNLPRVIRSSQSQANLIAERLK